MSPPSKLAASLGGPVERRRLVDDIHERLATAIKVGALPPGQRLVEAQLARDLGVSRAPVREALRLLERTGLAHAQGGLYFVPSLGIDDLRELVDVRIALERVAVTYVARRADDEEIATLKPIVARMGQVAAAPRSPKARLSGLDASFHRRLCELSRHARLQRVWAEMADQIDLAIATTNLSFPRYDGMAEDHDVVVTALLGRDAAECEQVITRHIQAGMARYEAVWAASGGAPGDIERSA